MPDTDALPPVQDLILEVLAARWRLGEVIWTFKRNPSITKALGALERLGLVAYKSGVIEDTFMVSLTEEGHASMFVTDGVYVSPLEKRVADLEALTR